MRFVRSVGSIHPVPVGGFEILHTRHAIERVEWNEIKYARPEFVFDRASCHANMKCSL